MDNNRYSHENEKQGVDSLCDKSPFFPAVLHFYRQHTNDNYQCQVNIQTIERNHRHSNKTNYRKIYNSEDAVQNPISHNKISSFLYDLSNRINIPGLDGILANYLIGIAIITPGAYYLKKISESQNILSLNPFCTLAWLLVIVGFCFSFWFLIGDLISFLLKRLASLFDR